ncbi:MAG: dCTP deaminase [SAR202 cluster bacterium]|jgi:dCTP deaminase|nr:dCTP deaminase [Chloroflexota bacterium]MDP6421521.1 dCTP deaminase [SAR202 cluster bacterium]HAL48443.1 dCTP deaminase [Dehalococcoidia bacterium]MDP6663624.1 dCTP deaminase [SAR202 cluster bacterium]MDP6801350.1 dCTP deaminase [SAR202 cluster bacterium]|tara:strand:+ start:494 stop:1096 length:603 start_codon:yes stop_codon:yes gene_type:complete
MILSDRTIRQEMAHGRIVIDPLAEFAVQPASVDIRLDREILIFRNNQRTHIDVTKPADDVVEQVMMEDGVPFLLHPGQFALGSTFETVTIPDDIVARIEGKSSLARYGLLIHSTAGFVDPGWSGKLTLEFSNVGILGITLYYGMKIGHISFTKLSTPADNPYGSSNLRSKYQGQDRPATSKYYMDYQLPFNGSEQSAPDV